jgi:hypothetical protein
MERDRATVLASRQDLQLIRQEIGNRHALLVHEIASLRREMAKDLETLRLKLTVQLDGMMVIAMGLLLAALKLT